MQMMSVATARNNNNNNNINNVYPRLLLVLCIFLYMLLEQSIRFIEIFSSGEMDILDGSRRVEGMFGIPMSDVACRIEEPPSLRRSVVCRQ